MPGGDRTGPIGMGPMTGRGAGFCAGSGAPGFADPAPGRGFGMGRGRGRIGGGGAFGGGGRGFRRWYYATGLPGWMRFGARPTDFPTADRETEKRRLEALARRLEAELEDLRMQAARLDRADSAE